MESLLDNRFQNFKIVLVDNNSGDHSTDILEQWMEDKLKLWFPSDWSFPCQFNYKKNNKLKYTIIDTSSEGNNSENTVSITNTKIIFIKNFENSGFAGGINLALKFIYKFDDFKYILLLNNDTVVPAEAIQNALACAEKDKRKIGMFSPVIMHYDRPEIIQAYGGKYNKFFGTTKHLLAETSYKEVDSFDDKFKPDYLIGAAIFLSKEFLQKIKYLTEDYFLYFEELDLAQKLSVYNFNMKVCVESKVFHKEGASIGTSTIPQKRSYLSDYYGLRNRLIFSKRFFSKYFPFVLISYFLVFLIRLKRGHIRVIKDILKFIVKDLWKY